MSDLATVRAAIVAKLAAVAGIGIVQDYERFAANEKAFRELYQSGERILGWHVRRVAVREVCAVIGVGMEVASWRITGLHALNDAAASEKLLDDLVEDARAAFRSDETLGGTVSDLSDLTAGDGAKEFGLQQRASEPVMFAGVLCHRVILALTTSRALRF